MAKTKEIPGLNDAANKCAESYCGWSSLSEKEIYINIFKTGVDWILKQGNVVIPFLHEI